MVIKSLKSKLVAGVSVLVICSGLLLSVLVTQRYGHSLFDAMTAQAQYLTHAVALEAADMVLINDPVSLQKMFDDQLRSNPSVAYLFVLKDGRVVAHTFKNGIPVELLTANDAISPTEPHLQEIASKSGKYYLDMAMPIFEGKAGVLRLGFSEDLYRGQVKKLWLQMASLSLFILLLSLAGSLFFVRRITGPLTELARAADKVDHGDLGVRVGVHGQDEVAMLSTSFNKMVASLQSYTTRLEEQTMELERAHNQARTFCGIVQEIGALGTLQEIGIHLIKRFQSVVPCNRMALSILNDAGDTLFLISDKDARTNTDPGAVRSFSAAMDELKIHSEEIAFTNRLHTSPLIFPDDFSSSKQLGVLRLSHGERLFGALFIACPGNCRCKTEEVNLLGTMLSQATGVIKRALLHEEEVRDLQNRLGGSSGFCGMVAKDHKMQVIFKLIEDIAPSDATVLIQGESGTGKELLARAIHQQSTRSKEPFMVINCSAYSAGLLESELFGHERGAFTGAIRQKPGRFEQANGGTVFLDEIGEISPSAQIKLLRVLQTREFERLGGEKTLSVDVRILAATNKNLLEQVKKGDFREDLYYRLNVIPVHLPPLREREGDIPCLAGYFLHRFATAHEKVILSFSSEAMKLLLDYSWPGNVRELENSIEHAVVLAKSSIIESSDLPASFRSAASSVAKAERAPSMEEHEKDLLERVLEECGWNKKEAANRLKISRNTLYVKLKKYRIERPVTH